MIYKTCRYVPIIFTVIASDRRERGNLNNLLILKLAQPPYQTIKTRSRPEEKKNKHQPWISTKKLVEQVTKDEAHNGARRQHESKRTQCGNFPVIYFRRLFSRHWPSYNTTIFALK